VVEINLVSDIKDLDVWRIRRHPLLIRWTVQSPVGSPRTTDTDGPTLVQYFPVAEKVKVSAELHWQADKIVVGEPVPFDVQKNPEYGKRVQLTKEWSEYAAIAIAAVFAMVTGIGTQYDSTF